MSEPARQLQQVGKATRAMRGVADQALEWVRVSEERVAAAEERADGLQDQLKERAMLTLRKVSAEARERIAAERRARLEADSRAKAAEAARDRAEHAFEEAQQRIEAERKELVAQTAKARSTTERAKAEAESAVAEARSEAENASAAAREAAEKEFDANGVPRSCQAMTRRGSACQRQPLPNSEYCPSHQHLREDLEELSEAELVAA